MTTTARTLQKVLTEMKAVQDEFKGKIMPEEKAVAFEALAVEAKGMQDAQDRTDAITAVERKLREIPAAPLPDGEHKGEGPESKVAGYLSLGEFVVAQKALGAFHAAGMPKTSFPLASVKTLLRNRNSPDIFVPLSREQVAEVKAVPTLGSGVIEPTRMSELVRVTEHDRMTLRDVLNTVPTSADAVIYTRITSYTRAAAATAHGAPKSEAAMAMDSVTEPVRTIAVWIPVQNQQLSDLPALAGLINGELLFDVSKHLEELVMYGDGTGQEFDGILNDAAVGTARTVGGDTLIDIARRGITDVRVAGYEPNAILVHPRDWENIVLEKGTDDRYVWVVVTEGGVQRLWGVPVVETVATEDFAGNATEERNLLVGDFRRGATLWDREQAQISVGWQNDQFIRNMRTILAEGRWGFGVTRPGAFRKHETQAAVVS